MFRLIKNTAKALIGVRTPPQELAEDVARQQFRLHGVDPASIPQVTIQNIAAEALANGRDPTAVILRIRVVVAHIVARIGAGSSDDT
jgi:hypothetical protein